MQEYTIEVEIDEDGNVKLETKGMEGDVCIDELDKILECIDGQQSYKNKPEFYKKAKQNNSQKIQSKA